MKHNGPISGVATSEKYVATAGYDNQVILWSRRTGQAVARSCHDHLVNGCEFSRDQRLLVSASSDGTARLWSVPSLKLTTLLVGHEDDVMHARFSPDGTLIGTCSYDGTLIVFDASGSKKSRLLGHDGLIEAFCWADDGRHIHSCGVDGTIRTWDVETGKCVYVNAVGDDDVDAIAAFAGDGYIYGNDSGKLFVLADGETRAVEAHTSGIKNIAVSADRSRILSVGYDGIASVWDASKPNKISCIVKSRYPDVVWARSAQFVGDDEIVFGTFGSKYAVWNIANNQWDVSGVDATGGVNAVLVTEHDTYTIGDAGILKNSSGQCGFPGTLCNFLVSDGELILSGGQNGKVYDAKEAKVLFEHSSPLNCGAHVEIDGESLFLIGSYSGELIALRRKGREITHFKTERIHGNAIKGLAIQAGHLITGSADGELAVSNLPNLSRISIRENAHEGILNDVCAFPEGFATVSRDRTLRLWIGDQFEVHQSRHPNSIKSVASSKTGDHICTASYGGTVDVFDVGRRDWIGDIKRPTASGISSVAWEDKQSRFLAGSYDGNIYPIAI